MTDEQPPSNRLKQARILGWLLVLLAIVGIAALLFYPKVHTASVGTQTTRPTFGGPFTLIGADGRPFSSQALEGKPYAIYFGFTRCGDVCPTTLSRLAKLRREAANDDAMRIVFVTIAPANDGPKEGGPDCRLFGGPINRLARSHAPIGQVNR